MTYFLCRSYGTLKLFPANIYKHFAPLKLTLEFELSFLEKLADNISPINLS